MLQKNEKIVLLWGYPFCWAPVQPNMLNMPKSASEDVSVRNGDTDSRQLSNHCRMICIGASSSVS